MVDEEASVGGLVETMRGFRCGREREERREIEGRKTHTYLLSA